MILALANSLPFRYSASMIRSLVFFLASAALPALAQNPPRPFEAQTVSVEGKDRAFLLMRPEGFAKSSTQKFPLLLFLHGAGERGTDNVAQLKHFPEKMAQPQWRAKYPCFLIAPQCEPNKQWVDAPWGDKQPKPMASTPSEMMNVALAALEKVRQDESSHIDATRIYLTGLSMGGYGSWELAMRHPEWFAAVAPICGGGGESKAPLLKSLPVWAFHGDKDTVVWPERSQRMVDAINRAGGAAKMTLLLGVGHDSWSGAYDPKSGLLDWIFAQRQTSAK